VDKVIIQGSNADKINKEKEIHTSIAVPYYRSPLVCNYSAKLVQKERQAERLQLKDAGSLCDET
jgi:hypothetical protein